MTVSKHELELQHALHSLSGGAVARKLQEYIKEEKAMALNLLATENDNDRLRRLQGRVLLLTTLERLATVPPPPPKSS